MKQIKKTKKQESGRSMIEMVGVLAVMGLITAGAFVLISSAMRSQKISRADDDISAIAAGVRLLYNTSENFSGVAGSDSGVSTLKVLGYNNVTPPYGSGSYALTECKPTTNSDGVLTSCTKNSTPANNTHFAITFPMGTDQGQCNTLAKRTWAGSGTGICVAGSGNNPTYTVQVMFGKE